MRKFRMVHETPSHYVMHNGSDHFHIAKESLTPDIHEKIRALKGQDIVMPGNKMSEGGKVPHYVMDLEGKMHPETSMERTDREEDEAKQKRAHDRQPASDLSSSSLKEVYKAGFQKYSQGGEVPSDLSRDQEATKQEHEKNAEQLKRELSVPYADYGTNEDTPPPTIIYNFFHGHAPARKVQSFAAGGMALDEKAGMDPTEMQRAEDVARLAPTPEPLPETPVRDFSGMDPDMPPQQFQDAAGALNKANQGFSPQAPSPIQGLPTTTVSPMEQVSFTPQKSPVYSDGPITPQVPGEFPTGGLPQFQQGENETKRGIDMSAKAQSEAAQETLNANKDFAEAQAKREQAFQEEMKGLEAEQQSLRSDILGKKIDPDHYWNSQSTATKITTTLGLIFGGIGSGLTHQPSEAAAMLERAVKDDIDAQKEDRSTKMNLYKEGLEKFRDKQLAENYATVRAHTVLEAQIQQAAAKLGTKQAYALAQQAKGELDRNDAPKKLELAMAGVKIKALNDLNKTPMGASVDTAEMYKGVPDKIAQARLSGVFSPEEEKQATEEYNKYMNRRNEVDLTNDSFDIMKKNKNLSATMLPDFLPNVKQNTINYKGAHGRVLDKLTKSTTGRSTPFGAEKLEPSLPTNFSDEKTDESNRNAVVDLVKNAHDYPSLLVSRGLIPRNDPYIVTSSSTSQHNKKYEFKPK